MNSYVTKLKNDPFNFANQMKVEELEKIITHAADKYFNTQEPVLSDALYDLLIDFLKAKNPKSKVLKNVGSSVNAGNKTKLPYVLYSMDKVKPPSKELGKWLEKYPPPYYLSDKLDGMSALLVYFKDNTMKLYTRGDATEGRDVSYLLKYIPHIPTPETIVKYMKDYDIKPKKDKNMAFRGEIVVDKKVYLKHKERFKNERAMASGIVNSKKIDPIVAKDISLVIYEVVEPFTNIKQQYRTIKKVGLQRVEYLKVNKLNYEFLSQYFKDRRTESSYLIDGIIITNNQDHARTIKGNPKYAFAFKDVLEDQIVEAKIKYIEWKVSKDGYLNPIVNLTPVPLAGVTIKRVTAYNAKFVKDNFLGPGAIVKIVRSGDVIPKIIEVIKKAKEPQMPEVPYLWNETKVDVLVKNKKDSEMMKIREILYFFKKMGIQNLGEGNIKKLYNAGFDTVPKIIKATQSDFLKVDGFKERSAEIIYNNIHNNLKSTNLALLMASSNIFGYGFGYERAKLILDTYPNILTDYKKLSKEELIEKIKSISSFEEKTAKQFVDYLSKFEEYYNSIKDFVHFKKSTAIKAIGSKFKDQIVVFTGFRDTSLEEEIKSQGGTIGKAFNNSTTLIVCKDDEIKNGTNSKILKAKEKGIKILTKDELIKMLK
ncbi:NAD-dependent DNA ligase adenylation domain [seawater metagenome]|uniref:DNA ligase (NAD(+)) n=1 Tax=seawater metagenome TaxID=1561972 RepID=A0A5E8CMF8_9ZZZZ